MPPARAVAIVEQVASALNSAHRIGLVHRDVKPSNILVGEHDFAYLIDFGIARGANETGMTNSGAVIGTWAYLAPERITGQSDHRADIYALTCVLHECLTGSQPFPGGSIERQIGAHLGLPPPRPSTMQDTVPTEFDTVIARGMAKNPDDRYSTVGELSNAARGAITAHYVLPERLSETLRPYEAPTATAPTWAPAPPAHYYPPPAPPPLGPPPTQYRPFSGTPPPAPSPPPGAPRKSNARWWALAAGVVAVALVAAAVLVISNRHGGTESATTSSPGVAEPPANSGPFTGTFTAAFGPQLDPDGKTYAGASPAFTETWQVSSNCRPSGCVATAAAGSQFASPAVVFDDVGGQWRAVTSPAKSAPGGCQLDAERFDVVTLQPHPDGTLTGEWTTTTSQTCFHKRTVTFTRTGDTDVSALPDPMSEPPRVISPAEGLRGIYHSERDSANGAAQLTHDYGVRTDCLRTGTRCMSFFITINAADKAYQALVFGDGKWTHREVYDAACPTGGNVHVVVDSQYPLPAPALDPIPLLTGTGHFDTTGGTTCTSTDFDERLIRTGD
jgi:serine/threonine-protein kinase